MPVYELQTGYSAPDGDPSRPHHGLLTDIMSLPSPTAPVPDLPMAELEHVEISLVGTNDLTNREVRSDPILAALARKQGQSTDTPKPTRTSSFKARPAPANMGDTSVGPRMTKAAALRQGLKWEEPKRARPSTAGSAVQPFGTKRPDPGVVSAVRIRHSLTIWPEEVHGR